MGKDPGILLDHVGKREVVCSFVKNYFSVPAGEGKINPFLVKAKVLSLGVVGRIVNF